MTRATMTITPIDHWTSSSTTLMQTQMQTQMQTCHHRHHRMIMIQPEKASKLEDKFFPSQPYSQHCDEHGGKSKTETETTRERYQCRIHLCL